MKPIILLLTLLLSLSGCAPAPAGDGGLSPIAVQENDTTLENEPPAGGETGGEETHAPAQGDNVVPHEPGVYCGNTVTTVRYTGGVGGPPEGEEWEKSFWGSPSVELTDLLLYLDYSGDICRCLPEYEVETEFSDTPYGVNLTDAYARHDGKQVALTEEQVEQIRGIIEEITGEELDTAVE